MLKTIVPFTLLLLSCHSEQGQPKPVAKKVSRELGTISGGNPYSHIKDIPLPPGYHRIQFTAGSYPEYPRELSLKKDKTVYLYNGSPKNNQTAQFAVVDISTGNRDLQQCADAVMRMRAEYLYQQREYASIVFIDGNGKEYAFKPPYNRTNFDAYLQRVFEMCGSASLSKQLTKKVTMPEVQPGDVLIHGGYPGHAEMVMDVAVNKSGDKIFLLAQSYMPAQDIHILNNFYDEQFSPWYPVNGANYIHTPEYTFGREEMRRW